ncbi:MAG: STN domain-containing protein [Bacteroidetes bacterium]|nr:STN domain-containing protein [Bacteroidota bacterium]
MLTIYSINKMILTRRTFTFILYSFFLQFSFAQILEKKIDVNLEAVPLTSALKVIAENGDFSYSYNPAILPKNKTVTIHTRNTPVNEVLQLALASTNLEPVVVGHHVVLKNAQPVTAVERKPLAVKPERNYFTVSGYIFDGHSQLPIEGIKVNDTKSQEPVFTNEKGYFQLRFSVNKHSRELLFFHKKYPHDSFIVQAKEDTQLNLILFPLIVEPIKTNELNPPPQIANPLSSIGLVKVMFNEEILEDTSSKSEIKISPGQFSFITPAGTHGLRAGKFINRLSLNVLAGYSAGVKGIEIGGILNSNRHEVDGIQMAGLVNAVGGSVHGVQVAGISNVSLGTTIGIQTAGIHNHSDTIYGIQLAGMANLLSKKFVGLQIAGAMNVAENGYGGQISGFINVSTDTLRGIQIAGVANIANKATGMQIGLFNYADSLGGVAIGLFSFVRLGYHHFEISTSDLLPLHFTYRSGNHSFYNLFSAGIDPAPNRFAWGYGYGLGTSLAIKPQWRIHSEVIAYMLNAKDANTRLENLISRFQLYLRYRSDLGFGFSAGPSASLRYYDPAQTNYMVEPVASFPLFDREAGTNSKVQAWAGWHIGVEF